MRLSQYILCACDEFFDEISSSERKRNHEARQAIDFLQCLLANHIDGFSFADGVELIEDIKEKLSEIWSMISKEEKCSNHLLRSHYQELQQDLKWIIPCFQRGDFDGV